MDELPDLGSLIEQSEGETLDFKATSYDLADNRKKRDFVKDLASLANTPRDGDAHILLGVKKRRDGSFELWGLDMDIDDADLQSIAAGSLEPTPRFVYRAVQYEDVVLGLITVSPGLTSPVSPTQTLDDGFVKGKVYFRRGSKNDEASILDLGRIWEWLREGSALQLEPNPYAVEPAWSRYLQEVDQLSSETRHLLIVDDRFRDDADDLSGIGAGPWSVVFDFDVRSDVDGLLAATRSTVERHRALHIRTKGDPHTSRSPLLTTTWFFIRGLEGRAGSIPADGTREWRRAYRQVLNDECGRLAGELTPAALHVTVLWRDGEYNEYLAETLRSLDESFHDLFRPVFVTESPTACERLAEEFTAPVIEMPLHHFARGVQQIAEEKQPGGSGTTALPSTSGVPVELEPQTANWIAEEIELVPLGAPISEEGAAVGTFLRGGTVSWADLDSNIDARRDQQDRLTTAIRSDLEGGRITRFNLFHRPGAGGTTVGRRVAWELHDDFPCGLLRRTTPLETAERVARIYELTECPLLLVADGTDVAERELDDLYEYLRARRAPVVLLQVKRRQGRLQQHGERTFSLNAQLSPREVGRFVNVLSRDAPARAKAIEQLGDSRDSSLHRPVYFALTAYERDFRALPHFVSSRVDALNEEQRRALVYAAISLRYGQSGLSASAMRAVFGLPLGSAADVPSLVPPFTDELLVETAPGEWRIGHSLVADELLQQLLASGGDARTWRNHLADWGIQFIEFCRGELPVPSDELLELVQRVFVFRYDLDVLGREQSVQRRFSHFIEDIPVSEGKVRVLDALVAAYPEEHHFWAHVARFHAMDRKDFGRAMEAADRAVALSRDDSVVYHMRGMVRRYQLSELRQSGEPTSELVAIAQQASDDFDESRILNPENEHGYIAEAQMLIELLEHASQAYGDLFDFLSRRDVDPYLRESLDRVESLLAHVRREREGVGASQYETRASARVHGLYGEYSNAIQRLNSLLARQDVYQPPIRRQLAWAYLSRSRGAWSDVPQRHIDRVVDLLSENLKEEPQNDQNIRLWMQASRFQRTPPAIESVFEQVQYWRAGAGSVDATYYAYVLNALLAMDGSRYALQQYEQLLEECREFTRLRKNRDRSYEWLGQGSGIAQLVHQSRLGDWDHDRGFWSNTVPLARIHGRVARVHGPQAGSIEVAGGLQAFFVPARSGLSRGSENTPVLAFLGFSYDGPRAWDISLDGA